MVTRYEEYKHLKEWTIVENAIKDLVSNNDLELLPGKDYVVGYILRNCQNNQWKK